MRPVQQATSSDDADGGGALSAPARSYVGYWLHTFDADGDIIYQGQIVTARRVDYVVQLYSWLTGDATNTMSLAKSAIHDPALVRLYTSDEEMRSAYHQKNPPHFRFARETVK